MVTAKDVLVIGGGAAGLMAAIEAGKRGRSVLVLERSEKIGKKILISGGGRCNFTNLHASPDNYISQNPHFCKSALARYQPEDFVALVERHGIPYHEKKLGQLFCDGTSKHILEMLEKECASAQVEIKVNVEVQEITKGKMFQVLTNDGPYESESLIIATGGLSIPTMGATPFGYKVAEQFGHLIVDPKPGLVPLTWNAADAGVFAELTGLSADALVRCGNSEFRENILFTHRGLSGPAILQVSSYWQEGRSITIDLLPDVDVLSDLKISRIQNEDVRVLLSRFFPKRLAQKWYELFCPALPLRECSDKELDLISQRLHFWKPVPAGTEGFSKAEVTVGGISTAGLSSKTMESQKCLGLYFIGEAVDVTGHLGGYNFQWAWASGFAAGQAA